MGLGIEVEVETKKEVVVINVTDRDRFLEMIDTASDFTAKADAIPAIRNIFFQVGKTVPKRGPSGVEQVQGNALFVVANDGTTAFAQGAASEEGQPSVIESSDELKVLIPKTFADLLPKLSSKFPIKLTFDRELLTIQSGKSSYELVLEKADEFPEFNVEKDVKPIALSSKSFCTALKNAITFADQKNHGTALSGVHLRSCENGLLIESCDRSQGIKQLVACTVENVDLTLAKESISRICSVFDKKDDTTIHVLIGTTSVTVSGFEKSISCKVLDNAYPDLSKLVRDTNSNSVYINTKDMLELLSRALLYQNHKGATSTPAVMTVTTNMLQVNVTTELGKSEEIVELEEETKVDLRIGVDASRLITALKTFIESPYVRIHFKGSMDMLVITSDDLEKEHEKTAFVLPIRILEI